MRNLTVTLAVIGYYGFYTRQLPLAWVYNNFLPLLSASVAFSWALSFYLYASSFRPGALLAKGGNTGALPLFSKSPSCPEPQNVPPETAHPGAIWPRAFKINSSHRVAVNVGAKGGVFSKSMGRYGPLMTGIMASACTHHHMQGATRSSCPCHQLGMGLPA